MAMTHLDCARGLAALLAGRRGRLMGWEEQWTKG
jgi:hypothetical protein